MYRDGGIYGNNIYHNETKLVKSKHFCARTEFSISLRVMDCGLQGPVLNLNTVPKHCCSFYSQLQPSDCALIIV